MAYITPLSSQSSIRLLTLHRGCYNDAIECSLREKKRRDQVKYEALSYTWGNSLDLREIYINSQAVQIRTNLFEFLHRVRSDHDRTFWVDALCISQTDLDEKSSQVAMIGHTFSKATCVRAWVGQHDAANISRFLFRYSQAVQIAFRSEPDEELQASRITAWQAFIQRPYFNRTWIVQEIAMAAKLIIHCGDDSKTWEDLVWPFSDQYDKYTDFERLEDVDPSSRPMQQANMNIFTLNMYRQEAADPQRTAQWGIEYLVWHTRNTQCFDQRDRIYSMLFMESRGRGSRSASIAPDYNIDVPRIFVRLLKERVKVDPSPTNVAGLLSMGLNMTQQQKMKALKLLKKEYPDAELRLVLEKLWVGSGIGSLTSMATKVQASVDYWINGRNEYRGDNAHKAFKMQEHAFAESGAEWLRSVENSENPFRRLYR